MKLNYYSEEIFTLPAFELIIHAKEDGMIWALLSYLHQSNMDNPPLHREVRLLIEIYSDLNCHINAWFLTHKYPSAFKSNAKFDAPYEFNLGLNIATNIYPDDHTFELVPGVDMWGERESILKRLKNHPHSLSLWMELVGKYIELDELLMAVMILFLVRMNTKPSITISDMVSGQLELIKVYQTSGGFWSFVSEGPFLSKVNEILLGDATGHHLADSMACLLSSFFDHSIDSRALLRHYIFTN